MKGIFVLVLLIFSASPIFADEFKEIWECRDYIKSEGPVIVVAKIKSKPDARLGTAGAGTIEVANTKYDTVFDIGGFNRVWAWGGIVEYKPGEYVIRYNFTIQPNGNGTYDNNGTHETQKMMCEQKK